MDRLSGRKAVILTAFHELHKELRLGGVKQLTINIKGYSVLIDDEDYEKIKDFSWRRTCYGKPYFAAESNGIKVILHRIIMNAPDGYLVDHRDCNTLNNVKSNLRICDKSQNGMNRGKQANNTSGYKGVSWSKGKNKWRAYISNKDGLHHLGYFNCPTMAWLAYCKAAKEYHGEFARLN